MTWEWKPRKGKEGTGQRVKEEQGFKRERGRRRGEDSLGTWRLSGDAVLGPQRITTVYAKTGRSMPSSKTAMHVRSGDVLDMRPAPAKAYSFRNCVLTSLPGDQESQEWDGWGGGSKHRWPRSSAGKDSFI